MLRRFTLLFLLTGCARAAPQSVAVVPPRAVVTPAAPAPVVPRLAISVDTDAKVQNRVHVELRFDGPLAAGAPYPFRPAHAVTQSNVATERLGTDSVHVRYALDFAPALDAAEAIEMKAAGEDLFALPDNDDKIPVDLTMTNGGVITNAVSTFGIGTETHFDARPSELRNGYYITGDIGTATFHAGDGNDFAGWIDHTAFDPRWVAAVTAATRGAVDAWVGRTVTETTPPLGYLFVATKRDEAPVIVTQRTRGLFISVDRRATWTASARILVAQALVQRYIGGFLWIGNRELAPSGWFWSEGFSRAIAREVLYENGALDATERADEMNALLSAATFATEPREIAVARGALVATAFDVEARKRGSTLQRFVGELLEDAAKKKADTFDRAYFDQHLRATGGDEIADVNAHPTKEIPLPVDLLGRCWRLKPKLLVPFELGFTTSPGEELVVQTVKPKSRAEAAGVRVGDVVTGLDYRNGNPQYPVKMTIQRGEKKIPISFSPAGQAKPGRIFDRVSGIPDVRC